MRRPLLRRKLTLVHDDGRCQEVSVCVTVFPSVRTRQPRTRFRIGPPIPVNLGISRVQTYEATHNCLHILRAHLLGRIEAFEIPGLHGQLHWRGVRDLGFPDFSKLIRINVTTIGTYQRRNRYGGVSASADPISGTVTTVSYPLREEVTGTRDSPLFLDVHSLSFAAPIEVEGGWS
jgi:hypothetical protein